MTQLTGSSMQTELTEEENCSSYCQQGNTSCITENQWRLYELCSMNK